MSKRPSKQVDLVIYKGGERIIVGRASLDPDGKIEAQIARDIREDVKAMVYGDLLDCLSLNPKPSVGFTYYETSANSTLKIQE